MARTKTELDDYIGIPVNGELKKRIKRIADKRDPRSKVVPMARAILERGVELEERQMASAK